MADVEDDEALVARANAGDESAFEELYRRHGSWVVALAYRFTRDRDDALDVLQDAFAHLWGKFPGFALTTGLRGYLYPVVRNLSVDRLRSRRPAVDVAELADRLRAPDPPSSSDLGRILAVLPDTHREVVLLRFADDLSLHDIAAALAIPLGTVKSRLHHAIELLRRAKAGE